MANKERLDILLVNRTLCESREKAKAFIMAGVVYVNDVKADKAGLLIDCEANICIRDNPLPYVSRGGLKLEKAIHCFQLDLSGKTVADIGASTGGFTDCALQHGAAKVFSIDVGYGQLDWKLRQDPRVICMERTNIRSVTLEDIGEPIDICTIDVAFISLSKVLPVVYSLLKECGEVVALIKPQFEAGRDKVGKHGVVRDPKVHMQVIQAVIDDAVAVALIPQQLNFSPVTGPKGNIEYLIHLVREGVPGAIDVQTVVWHAHQQLTPNK